VVHQLRLVVGLFDGLRRFARAQQDAQRFFVPPAVLPRACCIAFHPIVVPQAGGRLLKDFVRRQRPHDLHRRFPFMDGGIQVAHRIPLKQRGCQCLA
jgi:hypothetical protein